MAARLHVHFSPAEGTGLGLRDSRQGDRDWSGGQRDESGLIGGQKAIKSPSALPENVNKVMVDKDRKDCVSKLLQTETSAGAERQRARVFSLGAAAAAAAHHLLMLFPCCLIRSFQIISQLFFSSTARGSRATVHKGEMLRRYSFRTGKRCRFPSATSPRKLISVFLAIHVARLAENNWECDKVFNCCKV